MVGMWKLQFISKGNAGHNPSIPDGALIDFGFTQWHSDGTEIQNSAGVPGGGFCLGVWAQTGFLTFELNHFPIAFNTTTGAVANYINIREQVTLSPSSDSFTGTFTEDIYDPQRKPGRPSRGNRQRHAHHRGFGISRRPPHCQQLKQSSRGRAGPSGSTRPSQIPAPDTSIPARSSRKDQRGYCIPVKAQLDVTSGLTRQEKLEVCVKRVSQGEGVPPFCDHANEVLVRTLDLDGGSCKKLVQVILQDVGLASQVLRLANSAMYNHSSRPIMNIAHALAVLGWLEVRSMASAVRYIEHFANRSPGLRELVLASVLTAVQSREVAAVLGYPHPEEAYICGLFRNLGEVLIACHYPDEHSRIVLILDQENIPERAACLRVLDFSWDDVGVRVAARWQMPPAVRLAMDPSAAVAASPLDRSLASIANYGHKLTRALYRNGATIDKIHLETALNPAGQPVLVSVRDLCALVDLALDRDQRDVLYASDPHRYPAHIQAGRARPQSLSSPIPPSSCAPRIFSNPSGF